MRLLIFVFLLASCANSQHRASSQQKLSVYLFVSSGCPCSQSHAKIIRDFSSKHPKTRIIASDQMDQGTEELEDLRGLYGQTVEQDPDGKLAEKFGAWKTPHLFILNDHKVVYAGPVTNRSNANLSSHNYLEDQYKRARSGDRSKIELEPLGCELNI